MFRVVSETNAKQAPCRLLKFILDTVRQLTVFNEYANTLQIIIQSGQKYFIDFHAN